MWLSVPLRGRENLTLVGTHIIQDKCDYLCLVPNVLVEKILLQLEYINFKANVVIRALLWTSLLRMAVCSVQARKCGYSECGIWSRTCGYMELSEVRPSYPECPTPNIGTIWSLASYKILLQLEHLVVEGSSDSQS